MLRKNKNKEKRKSNLPTEEEMLSFKPRRIDIDWKEDKEGIVKLTVPKFKSSLGKSFCKFIKKDNYFKASFDRLGSIVWKNCDGNRTVKEILEILKKEFPDEKDIDNRLYLFLQQMDNLNYLDLK